MSHRLYVSIVVGFFVRAVLPQMSLARINDCSITGKVTDSESGELLPGVNIYLVDLRRGAVTGEDGIYRIENVGQGVHMCKLALIGYRALNDTFSVESGSGVIERNYELTPRRPLITTTKEIEEYQEHLRQLSLKSPVLTIRLDSLSYYDGALFLFSTFSNDCDTTIYIIKEWQCGFTMLKLIVFDSSHHRVEPVYLSHSRPDIIDLSCDAVPLKLFDRSDLIEIKPHASARYRTAGYYGLNRLPPGRYKIGSSYVFAGPDKIRGWYHNPTDDAVVIALRGSYISGNTIDILTNVTDIVVLDKKK